MQFADVVGHDALKQRLRETLREKRVAQSYLFLEQEGSGGLPLAMAFAQLLNCESPTETDSCGECNSCHKIGRLIHADVHYTFPIVADKAKHKEASEDYLADWRKAFPANPYMSMQDWIASISDENKQGNITAKEITNIIKGLSLTHLEGQYKVQVIWGAENLEKEGNKLLKLLEEPPERTVFLMVAQNSERILPTILSRSQSIKVPRIAEEDISKALVAECGIDEARAAQVASMAEGSWPLALHLAEEGSNDNLGLIKSFLNQSIGRKNVPQLLKDVEAIVGLGRVRLKQFLEYMLLLYRRSMVAQATGEIYAGPNTEENEFIQKLSARLGTKRAQKLPEQIGKTIFYIERNGYGRLVLFNLAIQVGKALKQ